MLDFNKEIKPDIATYYNDGELRLPIHLYLPKGFDKNKKYKAVVAIHGGSWEAIKETPDEWDGGWMRHTARYYADKGLVGIVFSYRCITLDGVYIPEIISDCNYALKFIKENYPFIDLDNVIFMGDSAGGQLCLALAMGLTLKDEPYIKPKMVVAYNPVTDCALDKWMHCSRTEEDAKAVSPIYNIKKLSMPVLVMHGTKDIYVDINDSRTFVKKMQDSGCDIELIEREGENHAFILYGFWAPPEEVIEDYRVTEEHLLKKFPDLYE